MADYIVTLTVDAARLESVQKKLREAFGKDSEAKVEKIKHATSRADRLSEAESSFEDAKVIVDELKDEIQNWLDGLPENLQNGSKADELNECISELDDLSNNLENCDFSGISFPGMY